MKKKKTPLEKQGRLSLTFNLRKGTNVISTIAFYVCKYKNVTFHLTFNV